MSCIRVRTFSENKKEIHVNIPNLKHFTNCSYPEFSSPFEIILIVGMCNFGNYRFQFLFPSSTVWASVVLDVNIQISSRGISFATDVTHEIHYVLMLLPHVVFKGR